MKNRKIYFRVDGNAEIGLGHFYRTFVLAREFVVNGFDVFYISKTTDNYIKDLISQKSFTVIPIAAKNTEQDLRETLKIAKNAILICDNYGLTSEYYQKIKKDVSKLVAFDDINDRHYPVDILINQNFKSETFNFSVNPFTKILSGINYSLIREEFSEIKNQTQTNDYLLIIFGATDPENYTNEILNALSDTNMKIKVILGAGNEHKNTITNKWGDKNNISIFINPKNIEEIMNSAKLVVSAAGSTVWELAFLGKPMILVKAAENQEKIISELKNESFIETLSLPNNNEVIKNKILDLFYDKGKLKLFSEKLKFLVDGKGKKRIYNQIINS